MTPEKAFAMFSSDFLALAIGIFAGAGMTRFIEAPGSTNVSLRAASGIIEGHCRRTAPPSFFVRPQGVTV